MTDVNGLDGKASREERPPIKPLIVHNFYQQSGGEDQVFAAETSLLRSAGHDVLHFTASNDDVEQLSKPALAKSAVWNGATYRELRALIRRERPSVVHLHNTLPLISPSAYYAAKHEKVAVVQTLHNYRLVCPNALLFRDGKVCELCLKKRIAWPGVKHACYRSSKEASGVVASMVALHGAARTWTDKVDVYVALTDFARMKFIEGGLPAEKIAVKPNFLAEDPGAGSGAGKFALFVGRLSPEKGVETLLAAWNRMESDVTLKIVGDGPLAPEVAEKVGGRRDVEWLGRRAHGEVIDLMKEAHVLIFPSLWYEGFPMTIVEAFAAGLPVVASRLGSMSSLIDHKRTGLHFRAGDAGDLASKVAWAFAHPGEVNGMRRRARAEFENKYDAARNYDMLLAIYERAMASNGDGTYGRRSRPQETTA